MTDWVDDLVNTHVEQRADEEIRAQKHKLAVEHTERLRYLLEKRVSEVVAEFQRTHPARVEGPISIPDGLKVRTESFPLRTVEFNFLPARLTIERHSADAHDAPVRMEKEFIFVRADFNREPWFEFQGAKIPTIEEVVQLLLTEVFRAALVSS